MLAADRKVPVPSETIEHVKVMLGNLGIVDVRKLGALLGRGGQSDVYADPRNPNEQIIRIQWHDRERSLEVVRFFMERHIPRIPKIFDFQSEYSTIKDATFGTGYSVTVMERIYPIDWTTWAKYYDANPVHLVTNLFRAFGDLMDHGVFHTDPHAGNVVLSISEMTGKLSIRFVDFFDSCVVSSASSASRTCFEQPPAYYAGNVDPLTVWQKTKDTELRQKYAYLLWIFPGLQAWPNTKMTPAQVDRTVRLATKSWTPEDHKQSMMYAAGQTVLDILTTLPTHDRAEVHVPTDGTTFEQAFGPIVARMITAAMHPDASKRHLIIDGVDPPMLQHAPPGVTKSAAPGQLRLERGPDGKLRTVRA